MLPAGFYCPARLGQASNWVEATQSTRPSPHLPPVSPLSCQVSVVTLDKTGTLTKGSFQLVGCHPRPGWTQHQLLRLLGSLERGSSHPLAAAVLGYAAAQVGRSKATCSRADLKGTCCYP